MPWIKVHSSGNINSRSFAKPTSLSSNVPSRATDLLASALVASTMVCREGQPQLWQRTVPGELGGYPKSGGRKNPHMGISWGPKKLIWVYFGEDGGGVL